jgi:hypothetical protein
VLALSLSLSLAAGCAEPSGMLVILQNQRPSLAMDAKSCDVPADVGDARLSGVFDVDLDRPYPYFVFPLIENRLPSVVTSGGVQRSSVTLVALRVEIEAPAGVSPAWAPGCPGTFDAPLVAGLDPGQIRSLVAQGFRECHSAELRSLIEAGAIPADLSRPVVFRLNLTAIADHNGSELLSNRFPFPVQACAGCLQAGFPDTPSCASAPSPNPYLGNPCNIAQDEGGVLCCENDQGSLVCPAP